MIVNGRLDCKVWKRRVIREHEIEHTSCVSFAFRHGDNKGGGLISDLKGVGRVMEGERTISE